MEGGEAGKKEAEKMGRWEGENKSEIPIPKSKMEGVPIIAITASAFGEQRNEILASGCNDMVTKPFQTHEIFEMMDRFLDLEYIYEPEGEAAIDRVDQVDLTSDMLAGLPEPLGPAIASPPNFRMIRRYFDCGIYTSQALL